MRSNFRWMAATAVCILSLAGCDTQLVRDDDAIISEWRSAVQQTDECVTNAKSTNLYLRLEPRLVLFPGQDPRAALKTRIPGTITPEEKEDLLAWLPMIDQCREIRLEVARRLFPSIASVLSTGQSEVDTLFGYLMDQQMTVGDFNTRFIRENGEVLRQLRAAEAQLQLSPSGGNS
jgi:hypothetical protein